MDTAVIWTIGHSTHPADEFVELLRAHEIESLVDVRSFPGSRRCPWFDKTPMRGWLGAAGVDYTHLRALGGRRGRQDGVDPALNDGWHNTSFHNYADYTTTAAYEAGLADLQARARERRLAFMCSEVVPWRCHRSLIASSLTATGWDVRHIVDRSTPQPHVIGAWGPPARIDAGHVTYPANPQQLTLAPYFSIAPKNHPDPIASVPRRHRAGTKNSTSNTISATAETR